MHGQVKITYLSPEELQAYKEKIIKKDLINQEDWHIGDGRRKGRKMDKDQIAWQKKVIHEENIHDQLQKNITRYT
ncbi:hypothetical protein H5P36_06930 [Bacillus sp. APMAM]|nr:hypothetical protein [Bacillus sp. APMAM]RTZ56614.1 hypothetical protein EKO25_06585 [Bacillus sp. SAJ1]